MIRVPETPLEIAGFAIHEGFKEMARLEVTTKKEYPDRVVFLAEMVITALESNGFTIVKRGKK